MNTTNYPPPSVPLSQKHFEFSWLLWLYKTIAPKHVLEVGTSYGGSLWAWAHNCPDDTTIVAVDNFAPEYDNRARFSAWQAHCRIITIQGASAAPSTVAEARKHAPYHWLFIDADHSYEAVLRDWDNYKPMVAPGGVIVFHDIVPNARGDIQVSRLWSEIQRDGWPTLTICEDMRSDTCGIGVVFARI